VFELEHHLWNNGDGHDLNEAGPIGFTAASEMDFHCSVNRVIVAADNPWLVPKNCSTPGRSHWWTGHAGTATATPPPSAATSVHRCPVASSMRRRRRSETAGCSHDLQVPSVDISVQARFTEVISKPRDQRQP
jgi:hypothetical protein